MQNQKLKPKISNFELWFVTFSFQLLVIFALSGCAVKEFLTPAGPPYNPEIAQSYYQIKLKMSSSADVLATIHKPEYERLSQSKSVVASLGQKKKGYKIWLKMVAFDEDELTARRKYLFIEDERPKVLFTEPWESVIFNCQMVLEKEVLDEPYSNENARRIAILKQVLTNVRSDVKQVASDYRKIEMSGMMMNQALEAVLVKLVNSPAEAAKLNEPDGLEFSHMSLDKGKIQMVVVDDIVTVKIRLGSLVKKYKISFEKDIE